MNIGLSWDRALRLFQRPAPGHPCSPLVSRCGEIRQCDVRTCAEADCEAAQDDQLRGVCEQNETWMRRSQKVGRKLQIAG